MLRSLHALNPWSGHICLMTNVLFGRFHPPPQPWFGGPTEHAHRPPYAGMTMTNPYGSPLPYGYPPMQGSPQSYSPMTPNGGGAQHPAMPPRMQISPQTRAHINPLQLLGAMSQGNDGIDATYYIIIASALVIYSCLQTRTRTELPSMQCQEPCLSIFAYPDEMFLIEHRLPNTY